MGYAVTPYYTEGESRTVSLWTRYDIKYLPCFQLEDDTTKKQIIIQNNNQQYK